MIDVVRALLNKTVFRVLDVYVAERGIPMLQSRFLKNTGGQKLLHAAISTGEYVSLNMPGAQPLEDRKEGLLRAVELISIEGMCCEFGVYRGWSANLVASNISSTLHGFDSFKGLPESWRAGFDEGAFALEAGDLPKVRENVELHVGWYNETLPDFLEKHDAQVAFLHLDSDLYSSTSYILSLIGDRIQSGTVVVFDDYLNYPGWQNGDFKAWQEFIERTGLRYEYIGHSLLNSQVVVRILD